MAKTKEELNELRNEYQALTAKLKELTESELQEVAGGIPYTPGYGGPDVCAIYMGYNPSTLYTSCPSQEKGKFSECEYCPLNSEIYEENPPIIDTQLIK